MEFIPDEIYELICRNLSTSDLKTMMLVDHHAKFIIENSPVLMEKLPLNLTDENNDFYDEGSEKLIEPLMNSRRRVRKVIVELKRQKIMKYLAIFQKFGDTIRVLQIKNYAFETIDQLRIILRYLHNLNTLILSNITFQRAENKVLNSIVQVPKVSLRELRNVVSINSDPKLFCLFTINPDIQLKTIRLQVSDAQSFQYCDFVEMMNQQRRLKQLILEGITCNNCDIFHYDGLSVISQLDNLTIENCIIRLQGQMRNLIQLIESQQKLNVLRLINTPIPSSFDVMFTFRQICAHHIRELHVDIRDVSVFHSHHFVNQTINDLTVHGNFAFENLPVFVNFIKMFPNVFRLKLVGDSPIGDKYLFHILSTHKKLEELYIPGFTSRAADSNFSNLSFINSKLHTLVLDYIDYDIKFFGWKNIVTNLRSIEKLIVKRDYGKVSNEIIDVIINNLSLKHLELGIGVVSEKILHNILHNNYCDQLKVLKIAKSDFQKIEDKFDFTQRFQRNHLVLHLCENEYFYSTKLAEKGNIF